MDRKSSVGSQRGVVVIQVAVFLLVLIAFSAFVLDYGIMWVARRQAQNAADAGALAGAIHLLVNPTDDTNAILNARKFAKENAVWNAQTPDANILINLPIACPPGSGGGTGCVRVDVVRGARDRNNVQHTNYLPTLFGNLVGVTRQGVVATATAQITSGHAVQCIKPWIVADKWTDTDTDNDPSPYQTDSWDREDTFTPGTDSYSITGGFDPAYHSGYQMPLKAGAVGAWSSGWAMEIDFAGHTGSADMRENIQSCPDWVPQVNRWDGTLPCNAQNAQTDPAHGCLSVKPGLSVGPTAQGVGDLVSTDAGATWVSPGDPGYVNDPSTPDDDLGYVNSPCMQAGNCTDYDGNQLSLSARIVPIATFDVTTFANSSCNGSGCVARVVNLVGFFVEGMCSDVYPNQSTRPAWCGTPSEANKIVIGRMMKYPGQGGYGGPAITPFTQVVRLVR